MYDWRYVCVCMCMSVLCLRDWCIVCVTLSALAFSYLDKLTYLCGQIIVTGLDKLTYLCCELIVTGLDKLAYLCGQLIVTGSKLLLLTVPRRYPYLHLYLMYVLRVFLTSWCMIGGMCVSVCV